MWFKHRAWIPIAWILAIVNAVGVPMALWPGEIVHASIHAVAAVGFGLAAWYLMVRRRAMVHGGS